VSSLITPQIGEFSFILVASGVASGIFVCGDCRQPVPVTDLEWGFALFAGALSNS